MSSSPERSAPGSSSASARSASSTSTVRRLGLGTPGLELLEAVLAQVVALVAAGLVVVGGHRAIPFHVLWRGSNEGGCRFVPGLGDRTENRWRGRSARPYPSHGPAPPPPDRAVSDVTPPAPVARSRPCPPPPLVRPGPPRRRRRGGREALGRRRRGGAAPSPRRSRDDRSRPGRPPGAGPGGGARARRPVTVGLGRCPRCGGPHRRGLGARRRPGSSWPCCRGAPASPAGAGRRDARAQTVAANVDVVLVVHALTEPPNAGRLERLLALVWSGGARPVVVLTKSDLRRRPGRGGRGGGRALAPGLPGGRGQRAQDGERRSTSWPRTCRPASTVAAVGRSGAGKSSLLNALAGGGGVRHRRRSVATARAGTPRPCASWCRCPAGAVLLDTPGLRGVQVWDVAEGLDEGVRRRGGARRRLPLPRLRARRRARLRGAGGRRGRARCRCAGWSPGGTCSGRAPRWPGGTTPGCASEARKVWAQRGKGPAPAPGTDPRRTR